MTRSETLDPRVRARFGADAEGRSRIRLAFVLAMSLGLATVLMLGLPLLYLSLPNPRGGVPVVLESAGRGVYVQADGRALRILPRASRVGAAADDMPSVARIEAFVVVAKQPGELSAYHIHRVGETETRPLARSVRRSGDLSQVVLRPGRLPDGLYELAMPRESMFGGEDYAYVTVSR